MEVLKKAGFVLGASLLSSLSFDGKANSIEQIIECKKVINQKKLTISAISDAILHGDTGVAHMAFAIVILTGDKSFTEVIHKRLESLSDSIKDMRLKAVGYHALAVSTNEDLADKLIPLLDHHDGLVRNSALEAIVELEYNDKLIKPLKKRMIIESDSTIKPVIIEALCRFDKKNKKEYINHLNTLASGEDNAAATSAVMKLAELKENYTHSNSRKTDMEVFEKNKKIYDILQERNVNDDDLKKMVMSKNHVLRIEAIEIIARKGSKSLQEWMLSAGRVPVAKARLMSAYYLFFTNNKEEAQKRLVTEKDEDVKVMLLGTLLRAEKELSR